MNKRKKKEQKILCKYGLESGKSRVNLLIILLVFAGAAFLSNILNTQKFQDSTSQTASVKCCNTGDGEACKPETGTDKTIQYGGNDYGLIKSGATFVEELLHLKDSGQRTSNGDPIILNATSDDPRYNTGAFASTITQDCGRSSNFDDLYFKKNPPDPYYLMRAENVSTLPQYCASVPNDQLIFVCRKNCFTIPAAQCPFNNLGINNCYGAKDSVYDIYYRLSDLSTKGVPEFIKNCDKSGANSVQNQSSQTIVYPDQGSDSARQNLQLKYFTVQNSKSSWFSPLCKPAIYLYPEKQTQISVKIAPKGKVTLTIPQYPQNGWNVTALPDGKIMDQNTVYPYLYYEAQIPDELVDAKTQRGYVTNYEDLTLRLNTLLPRLGLNDAERKDFVVYWTRALPKSPYYFIGVVPISVLDDIAPLSFNPQPQTTIRVALYFKALDLPLSVLPPTLTKISREGFTVVEWGGLFKQNKNSTFTCMM